MFATAIRNLAKKGNQASLAKGKLRAEAQAQALAKAEAKAQAQAQVEATANQEAQHWALESSTKKPTEIMRMIVERHGPLKVNECWEFAQTAGVKSKQHMKVLLRFLKEKKMVRVACEHGSKDKHNKSHLRDRVFRYVLRPPRKRLTTVTSENPVQESIASSM